MTQQMEEKEIYVFLDFQGKDTSTLLRQDNVYFRMLNLSENKPIVEVGDDVYEGTYDDVVGTNLFFEELSDQPQPTDLFENATPLTLQFLLKQTKILNLKKIGARQKFLLNLPDTESVNIDIKDDYRILLEKFENSKLNIDEYIVNEEIQDETERVVEPEKIDQQIIETENQWELSHSPPPREEWCKTIDDITDQDQSKAAPLNPIDINYIELQKIAEQPSKRVIRENPSTVLDIQEPFISSPKVDFIIWKNSMMRKVENQVITVDVRKERIEDFVDIDQSINDNIIQSSPQSPRKFTKVEKSKLLSFENFTNVSPLMKLIMLQDYEDTLRTAIDQMLPDELLEVGRDGYMPTERYDLIKSFKEELQAYLVSRLHEQYEMSGQPVEDIKLDITLSDVEIVGSSSSSLSDEEGEQHSGRSFDVTLSDIEIACSSSFYNEQGVQISRLVGNISSSESE